MICFPCYHFATQLGSTHENRAVRDWTAPRDQPRAIAHGRDPNRPPIGPDRAGDCACDAPFASAVGATAISPMPSCLAEDALFGLPFTDVAAELWGRPFLRYKPRG